MPIRSKQHGRGVHLAGTVVLTLVLLWPALYSGAPTAFSDSDTYFNGGGVAVRTFLDATGIGDMLAPAPADAVTASGAPEMSRPGAERMTEGHRAANVRSVPYSVFVNLSVRAFGPMAAVVPTAAVTAWLLWLMMSPLAPLWRGLLGATTAVVTFLPFYVSQMMPDIHAAWLIAIPFVLVRDNGTRFGTAAYLGLASAATAAILFHYSHIPLAAATGAAVSGWYLMRRNVRAAALVQGPLVLAVAINLAISVAMAAMTASEPAPPQASADTAAEAPPEDEAEDEPGLSLAPGRLPIVLARLLEDGVAVRYLSETCPENGFTICELYDRFPGNVHAALWGEKSITKRASASQMRKITAEEMALAWAVFRYDPAAQIWAVVENTAQQLVEFHSRGMRFADYSIRGPLDMNIDDRRPPQAMMAVMEPLQVAAVIASALAVSLLAWTFPAARVPVVVVVTGLLANAFICGALSAPAGRYQARVVWVLVAAGLALTASFLVHKARRRPEYVECREIGRPSS